MLYNYEVYIEDMGSITLRYNKDVDEALWHLNSARRHDNLADISREVFVSMIYYPRNQAKVKVTISS